MNTTEQWAEMIKLKEVALERIVGMIEQQGYDKGWEHRQQTQRQPAKVVTYEYYVE